eukprot:7619388-Alexandrium_andersonii.AAC.1
MDTKEVRRKKTPGPNAMPGQVLGDRRGHVEKTTQAAANAKAGSRVRRKSDADAEGDLPKI